ncbi:MAG: hypothetical protein SFU87_11755 [Chitinophagaceae bacterium]|nr:hypothetical protein [Chitinophagaceae bacterium]
MKYFFIIVCFISAGCSQSAGTKNKTEDKDNAAITSFTDSSSKIISPDTVKNAEAPPVDSASITEEDKALYAYSGEYELQTESEGAEGRLFFEYTGGRTFKFTLTLTAPDICKGHIEGVALVDRSQHAFLPDKQCFLHFNLEDKAIEVVQEDKCDKMNGECIFSGLYKLKPAGK